MTTAVEATWGTRQREVVNTVEQLDALLDRVDADARRCGRAQNVELTALDGRGTLGVVVGDDRSLLNHIPADNNPPYLASRGDENFDRSFTFYVAGDHHSESHWRHTITNDAARDAARVFLLGRTLDDRVRWEEV